MNEISFTIANVEKETGLSKDTLRMWERRYGFPAPARDPGGDRLYPAAQVEQLRQIKRLIDQGHRPGQLMTLSPEALRSLPARDTGTASHPHRGASAVAGTMHAGDTNEEITDLLELLRNHDAARFQQRLQQTVARAGLGRFVMDTVAPLTRQVGKAWEDGRFAVFEEHLFTELTKRVLRQAIANLPPPNGRPCILLTSVPDEPHVLGLLMAEALFALDGAQCVPLGAQMPLLDIARAATAHHADVVALSFSSAFSTRRAGPVLAQLRELLPTRVALWVGGEGASQAALPSGITRLRTLADGVEALGAWRSAHAAEADSARKETTTD